MWYPTVTLGSGIPEEKVAEVRGWIENDHTLREHIEKISKINRELLRRARGNASAGQRPWVSLPCLRPTRRGGSFLTFVRFRRGFGYTQAFRI
jgi:hypothetical protein